MTCDKANDCSDRQKSALRNKAAYIWKQINPVPLSPYIILISLAGIPFGFSSMTLIQGKIVAAIFFPPIIYVAAHFLVLILDQKERLDPSKYSQNKTVQVSLGLAMSAGVVFLVVAISVSLGTIDRFFGLKDW